MCPDTERSFPLEVMISFLGLLSLLTDKKKVRCFYYVKRICTVFLPKWQMSLDCESYPNVLTGLIEISIALTLETSGHRLSETLYIIIITSMSSRVLLRDNLSQKM